MAPPGKSKRLKVLILDGHSLAFRAFYALPEDLATSDGTHTNAVYGFTSMLIKLLQDESPTHVAVAFDAGRSTFRTEQYAEYKGTRDATPEPFRGQVALIRQVLDAMRIPVLEKPNYEADDILATLATQARAAGMEVLISSGDRDMFQLVNDHVTVLYPVRGVSDLWRMTPEAVTERYGVAPERYSDLAALVGSPATTSRGSPASAPRPRRSGSPPTAVWRASSRTWTASRARPARRCVTTSTRCSSTAGSTGS